MMDLDDLDRALAALPRADLGELHTEDIRARAQREFARAHARMRRSHNRAGADQRWLQRYHRAEPLLIAAAILLYLASAATKLLPLLG